MEIRILTDASADLSPEFVKEEAVTVLSMPIAAEDGTELDPAAPDFWEMLESGKRARTSQPNREEMKARFESAKKAGAALFCVFISSELSGTFDTATALQKEIGYEHIYLIDSKKASMGEGLIVRKAAALRKETDDPQTIFAALKAYRDRVRLYSGIDTLKFLARGGRLSSALYAIGNLLNVKPVITINGEGKIDVLAKKIGVKQANRALIALTQEEEIDFGEPVVFLYAKEDKNVTALKEAFRAAYPGANTDETTEIGHVVGSHIGPGGFGLTYLVKEKE